MQEGFVRFHAACNHQRQLMIAVECLLALIEDLKNGESSENENLPEDLMRQIVHLSQAMTLDMESFTWTLFRQTKGPQSTQQFQKIEGACHQLLDANLSVLQTAMAVARKFGHAPWITQSLADISARTQLIQALLREYAGLTPSATTLVQAQH